MRHLSKHFDSSEFSKDAQIPDDCLPVLTKLCVEVLEPIRERFQTALLVTSGYRPPDANAAAHGQPNSEHIYSPEWCAADILICSDQVSPRSVFDWIRSNPNLPYHQLILEHGQVSTIIHVSVNRQKMGVRSVLEGATANRCPYIPVDYVPYCPVQEAQLHLQE